MKRKENVAQALAVGLFLLSVYLLSYSGEFHSSDGQAMFAVTESLVRRGDYDINQLLWMGQQQGTYGLDGELYCRKGIATSLLSLPLAWLGLVVPFWGMVQTTLLFNAVVTALTGILVYLYVNRLEYSASTSLVLSLVFGLATLAWPYAKYFFSDPLASLSLFATAYFLLRYQDSRRTSDTLWAGTSLGLAMATRFANIITLPIFGLLLLAYIVARDKERGTRDKPLPPILAFALPLALTTLLLGGYNYARYGDVLQTGYLPQEKFSTPWLEGISGLLISPGRGLFLHAPVLLASLLAIPAFVKRHRLEAALALLISASHVLLYGRWFFWHAGYAWGPRFLVPIVPFAVILMAPLVEKISGKGWLAFTSLCLISVAIQILGLSVDFTLFQEGLLFRFRELRMFDPRTYFEFQFSPLLGQWALLRLENLDFAWVRMMGSPPSTGSGCNPRPQVDWPVLISNVALVIATALGLHWVFLREKQEEHTRRKWGVLVLMNLLIFGVTAFSLSRYKDDQHRDYRDLLSYLEAQSQPKQRTEGDAIIFNIPEDTKVLQNHYKGHLPVYGLIETSAPVTSATAGLLDELAAQHPGLWLIPSPQLSENGLDQHLRERGYQADDESFGGLRLVLYAFPRKPLTPSTIGTVFGEAIVLEGYALDESVRAGYPLHLDLYWQAYAPVVEDYQVFVHLLGEDGQRWAQKDGPPLLGTRPTSSWQPGERLTDRRGLLLPADMPAGSYHLRVGLYRLSDGSRLLTANGDDGLDLGPFSVIASE